MKRLAFACVTLLCLSLLALPAMAAGQENPFVHKLPFQTAVIKYKLSGSEQGTSVLYVDGLRQARERDSSLNMMGMVQKRKALTITMPDKVIEVDLTAKTAKSHGNMQTYMAQEFEKLSPADKATVRKNSEKFGGMMAQQVMGGKPETTQGTFLGKPVDIVTIGQFTSNTWKDTGITLKIKGTMMGMIIDEEAVSAETNVPIKSGLFEVPAGIQVVVDAQADQMMRNMAKSTLDMLKDPQFEANMASGQNPMMGAVMDSMANDPDMTPEEREELKKAMRQQQQQRGKQQQR
jgi:hypothetical protein